LKDILKKAREAKGMKTRELAALANIDQALISKFESGTRMPTKTQILKLAELLDIQPQLLITSWLKEKILALVANQEFGPDALKAAEAELGSLTSSNAIPDQFSKLLSEMESLKAMLSGKPDGKNP
jgi:transcriptional regulator with XRE-family HTH domain